LFCFGGEEGLLILSQIPAGFWSNLFFPNVNPGAGMKNGFLNIKITSVSADLKSIYKNIIMLYNKIN
jgi:hypothetical protein